MIHYEIKVNEMPNHTKPQNDLSREKLKNSVKILNISEVARRMGISRTFVSLVVNGHKTSRPVAKYIEGLLGVEPGSLFPYVLTNRRGEFLGKDGTGNP